MECPVCKLEFVSETGRRPKKFCSDPCKVKFWNAKKKEEIKVTILEGGITVTEKAVKGLKSSGSFVGSKTGLYIPKGEAPTEKIKIDYTPNGKPKNLDELKALCPHEKGTDEFRLWVSNERQKYGI